MKPLPIGLVLSGGTATAIAHVAVLKALETERIGINYPAGLSGGSIGAVLKALGMNIGAMQRIPELRATIRYRNRWWNRAAARFGRRAATKRSTTL